MWNEDAVGGRFELSGGRGHSLMCEIQRRSASIWHHETREHLHNALLVTKHARVGDVIIVFVADVTVNIVGRPNSEVNKNLKNAK